LTLVEMKIFIRKDECALFYHTRNKDILEELEVDPVGDRLRTYSHIGCNT
jgi:hypothetical protein